MLGSSERGGRLERRSLVVNHDCVVALGALRLREVLRLRAAEGDDGGLVIGHPIAQLLAEVHFAVQLVEIFDRTDWPLLVF